MMKFKRLICLLTAIALLVGVLVTANITSAVAAGTTLTYKASDLNPRAKSWVNDWAAARIHDKGYVCFPSSIELNVGCQIELTIPNLPAETYELYISSYDKSDRSGFQTSVNGVEIGSVVDTTKGTSTVIEHKVGSFTQETTGNCVLSMMIPDYDYLGSAGFYIDSVRLVSGAVVEPPSTSPSEPQNPTVPTSTGSSVVPGEKTEYLVTALSPKARPNSSAAWVDATIDSQNCSKFPDTMTRSAGAQIKVTLPTLQAGTYILYVKARDKSDRSKFDVTFNNTAVGSEVDTTSGSGIVEHQVGQITVTESSEPEVVFTITKTGVAGFYIYSVLLAEASVVTPTDPSTPTNPTNPTDPTSPTNPTDPTDPKEEGLLYTIACTSDLHIDRDVKDNFPNGLEPGFVRMCDDLKNRNVDMFLLGGDITSNNEEDEVWTNDKYKWVMGNINTCARAATKTGNVLYATGNHDFSVGSTKVAADFVPFVTGDYTEYITQNCGAFTDVYYQEGLSFNFPLAYRYTLNGLDYVVLNTPYESNDVDEGSYVYDAKAIEWVDLELKEIGKHKTAIVMGHYPLAGSNGLSSDNKAVSSVYSNQLKKVLLKYKNAIYLYAHDHGGAAAHIESDTFQRITPYSADGTVIKEKNTPPTSFVSAFMGSCNYYGNTYDPSPTGADNAYMQALIIKIYEDKIVFGMRNYGLQAKDVVPQEYVITRQFAQQCEHEWVAADCDKPKTCSNCGVVEGTALGHSAQVKNKKGASYTSKGYTGDSYCSRCGELLKKGKAIAVKKLSKPSSLKIAKISKTSRRISWKKVTGAKKYYIYRKIASGKWKKIATTAAVKLTFNKSKLSYKNFQNGKRIYFRIKAVAGSNASAYSNKVRLRK